MLFTSAIYFVFLLVVVALFWAVPRRFRIAWLLIASYVFYMAWSPPFGLIYAPVIFFDSLYFYWLSLLMGRHPEKKKAILIFGVTTELMLLGYFKYSNFLLRSLEDVAHAMNLPAPHWEVNVFLPLAISFTNFILIAYLVDIYRGREKPDTWLRFTAYVAFFPHLIAGPIVRASELQRQFDEPSKFDVKQFFNGLHLLILGFAMKVFVADQLAPYVDFIYGTATAQGFDTAWVATYSFAIQIFCDFAGYTLMAQGSALLLGYTLPENFNAPYLAINITDFWRRWHMSLSRWLRDYLYIPLGGNRNGRVQTYRNLFITMGLGGLWHGASWNFVIWGLLHGLYLSAHKFAEYFKINRFFPTLVAWALTFHVVCIAWVFFRARGFTEALNMLSVMFNPAILKGMHLETPTLLSGTMALTLCIGFLLGHGLWRRNETRLKENDVSFDLWRGVAYAGFLYLLITLKTPQQSFIYFQF